MAVAGVKQIAQAQRIIKRKRQAALIFAGGFTAGIVCIDVETQRPRLLPAHHNIALPFHFTRLNADIGGHAGQAAQVFQALL